MNQGSVTSLLQKHIPAPAVSYCLRLWQEHPFQLIIRAGRRTKVGDFTCRQNKNPRITVNAESHPFLFLITYVHEVAHLRTHQEWGWKVTPHGKEWKAAFRELCTPLLHMNVFPAEVNQALEQHLVKPRASSFSDARLNKALRSLDPHQSNAVTLAEIPEGSQFAIRGRWFSKGKQKRTRIVCRELNSRRNYLIAADTLITDRA